MLLFENLAVLFEQAGRLCTPRNSKAACPAGEWASTRGDEEMLQDLMRKTVLRATYQ